MCWAKLREHSWVFSLVWLVNCIRVKGKNVVPLKHIKEMERQKESESISVRELHTVIYIVHLHGILIMLRKSPPTDKDFLNVTEDFYSQRN